MLQRCVQDLNLVARLHNLTRVAEDRDRDPADHHNDDQPADRGDPSKPGGVVALLGDAVCQPFVTASADARQKHTLASSISALPRLLRKTASASVSWRSVLDATVRSISSNF